MAERSLRADTWPRIRGFARPYRRLILTLLGLVVLAALASVATPLLFKAIIDEGIGAAPPASANRSLILLLAGGVALLGLLEGALALASRFTSSRIGEGLIYDLRTRLFDHVQSQSLAFFTRTRTGALTQRLNADVLGAQQAFTTILTGAVANFVLVVFTLVAMLVLSWQVTLLALLLFPAFIFPARIAGRRLQIITRERYALNAEMTNTMTERFNVSGALLSKLYADPSQESELFAQRAARVRDTGVTVTMITGVFYVALTLVASLATALTYGVGGLLAADGSMAVGTLVALTALLARLYSPLTALSNVRVDVMTALVAFERVFEVLDLTPMVREPEAPRPLPDAPLGLRFEDVSFAYPHPSEISIASLEGAELPEAQEQVDVLRSVSFEARPGELVALVGHSGAGKTTISQLVVRSYDPTAGRVVITAGDPGDVEALDVREVALGELRRAVGVVTQDSHMFHVSLRDNLLLARPDASDEMLWGALERAQVADVVRRLPEGLDTLVGDRGYRLSGGEKQRVAIARLMVKNPRIVILDEATSHLDTESEALVARALEEVMVGRTSVVIAHRLSTVQRADRILVLERGQVVEEGSHSELVARGGVYAGLYEQQFAEAPEHDLGEETRRVLDER